MREESPFLLYDIEPCKHFKRNCIDDVIATLAQWLGRHHQLMYDRSWNFGYVYAEEGRLGDRLQVEAGQYIEDLERLHGIKGTVLQTLTADESIAVILDELAAGHPAVVTMNSYWLPWDENYQKNEIVHSIILSDYDLERELLFVTDPYFKVKAVELSFRFVS